MKITQQNGGQTVEFAMISLPFMVLFLALFEVVRLFWIAFIFEYAVNKSSREVRAMTPSSVVGEYIKHKIAEFPLLVAEQVTVLQPRYAESVVSLAKNRLAPSVLNASLAEYEIVYKASFVLLPRLLAPLSEVTEFRRVVLISHD